MKRRRLKHVAQIVAGQAPVGDAVSDNGVIPFLQGCAEFGIKNPKAKHYCDKATKWAPTGSWLISVRAPVGEINKANRKYAIGRGLAAIVPRKIDENYLGFALLHSRTALDRVTTGSTYDAVSGADIGNLEIPVPSEATQKTIADFLDRETARIDHLIEKKERLSKLLGEKRKVEIIRAVLRGNDCDVKLKDSRVGWLGLLPKHWEINKVKHIFRLSCKPAPANNDLELLSVYTDIGVRPRRELEQKGNKASTTDGYWIVRKGDLVVNKLLAWMGAVGHSEYDGVTSPAYDILRPINNGNSKYYHYLFRSETAQQELKRFSKGIMEMRLRLYFDQLGNIFVPEPPREEQDRIVSYIETEIDMRLSSLQDSIDQSVSKLHEFRSALITAAVTGQIDVTTWSRRDSTDRRLDQIEEEMSV